MTRSRPITILATAVVIPLTALAVAACGGGGATAATPPAAPASSSTAGGAQTGTVRVANTSVGSILVDSQGRTLYLFKADSGTKSACSGACAVAWPPLRSTGKPTAGSGVNASLLGTYNGHPLYLHAGDKQAADVNGQGIVGFGAAWYVLSPGGQQITSQPTGFSAGTTSGY